MNKKQISHRVGKVGHFSQVILAMMLSASVFEFAHATGGGWLERIRTSFVGAKAPTENGPRAARPLNGFVQEAGRGEAWFISPNEFDNYLHFNELSIHQDRLARAVISVGTFRAFNLLAATKRDYLIAMDYSPGVAEFNRALAGLVAKYDRLHLLALLIGQNNLAVPPNLDERSYVRQVVQEVNIQLSQGYDKALTTPLTSDPELHTIMSLFRDRRGDKQHFSNWLVALIELTETQQRYDAFFLGNEDGYRHVKKTIAEQRFVALVGSISGRETMASIGKTLRSIGAVVSELDVSNALEHVVGQTRSGGLRAFAYATRSLPFDHASRVLLTIDTRFMASHSKTFFESTGQPLKGAAKWYYAVFKPQVLTEKVADVRSIERLVETYVDLISEDELKASGASRCGRLFLRK